MRKQTLCITFCILIHLALFTIGSLETSYGNRLALESNGIYNRDVSQEKKLALHINTEDSDTEEYILEKDCERFEISFNFSRTIIKVLGENFVNTPLIICLNFEGSQIESVESGAFNNVPALQYLNMGRNSISYLFSFNGHNNLKTLILARQSNYYERNLEIIGEYPELRYLDLSGNKIASINWLKSHQDSHNQINRKSAFPKLKYLDLSYNNLQEFHVYYGSFLLFNQNITDLNLSNNNLIKIDLRFFTNLIHLKLDNNDLNGINEYCSIGYVCISKMSRLKYFSISNNKINSLSQYVFMNMLELVTLDLSNNQLEHISPELFHSLNSLENLYLNNNKLSSIHSFSQLSSLSVLSVAHNEIWKIGFEEIINAQALKKLYLDHNAIENIHESTFSKLESLEELYLDNNNLYELPMGWDNNLRNLRYLNLSNNKFILLESLSLSESLPVIRIDLINNNLIHMKAEVLRNLPENTTIYLIPRSEKSELSNKNL